MNLPPLTALRAFEAAARHASFSAAGRELNVTHAAVAQQVRALETHLGVALLARQGRGLRLTPDGQRLAEAAGQGFATIAAAASAIAADRAERPLRLSLTPSFAAHWLMPRLRSFWARHPDIALSLHPDHRVVDLRAERIDLAIRFGQGPWPGVECERLAPAQYVVVGAPALVGDRGTLGAAEMTALPWVVQADWPEQFVWLREMGVETAELDLTEVPTEELALSAARQGYGLMIESAALVEEDLSTGRLRAVHRGTGGDGAAYWLVTLPGPRTPALQTFVRWLKSVA